MVSFVFLFHKIRQRLTDAATKMKRNSAMALIGPGIVTSVGLLTSGLRGQT